jgi:thiol-disulfide isomerase/thioredoxin
VSRKYVHRWSLGKLTSLTCLFLIVGLMLVPLQLPAAEDQEKVYVHGSGPVEIYIFADYFCPPCQKIEPYLDANLPELLSLGVRVTFIDMPFSRLAPLYSRYFLYAANRTPTLKGVLHARAALVQIAQEDVVTSDQEMIEALKERGVNIRFFDIKPTMAEWGEIIRKYNVRNTPTCIVVKPGQEAQRYIGSVDIPDALDILMKELSGDPRIGSSK